jgi:hypothetical protein
LDHSAETAVLHVLSDILSAVDRGNFAALFYISAVDDGVFLQRQHESFGIGAIALNWFRSYLSDRTQYVRHGSVRSSAAAVHLVRGVPQGSVLDPILSVLHVADLAELIEKKHGIV